MKIAIAVNTYPSFAARIFQYVFVHDRARHYAAAGHEVHAYARSHLDFPAQESHEGVHIQRGSESECLSQIQAWQPDVLIIHAPHTWSIRLAQGVSAPKVAWVHGHETLWLLPHSYFPRWYLPLYAYDIYKFQVLGRFLQNCAAVVYVSQWVREASQRVVGTHDPTYVIPNPVDVERFRPMPQERGPSPQGISVRSLTNERYGLDIALRAYAGLTDTHLRLVGRGKLEQSLRSLARELGSSAILDTRPYPDDELPLLYNRHHYFVAPSRGETQGVAMCEAMACGLPVVATRVGAIPEFVSDGEDGYLVSPEDPPALRQAILQLVSDPSQFERMGANARRHMEAKCDSRKVIAQELQVLRSVLGQE